ncbi:hypothetical protein LU293_05630 [Moraxella nasovis]|uniref:hypothetical protein n=1 Tax=Moraxella nasovis TaxID=2904121 RepID=UPI001F609B32|nr:hypothetical protein [Moraxella nasovis]UNU72600.1 hypothetical protein LU293_05630 [Moraxella nasovis]
MKTHTTLALIAIACLMSACNQQSTQSPSPSTDTATSHTTPLSNETQNQNVSGSELSESKPIITADGKTQINWQLIDTNESRANLNSYNYPIAIDSLAVKNYAKAYGISDKKAQHSIVVSMAAPEVLAKVLDQLIDGKYVGHSLTDGDNPSLIIETTDDVVGETHDYVFSGEFGKGLVLPVIIQPQSPKTH